MRQRTSFPLLFVPTLARKKKREKNGGGNSLKKAFCSAFPLVVPCFVQKRKPMTSPLAVAHRSRKQSEGGARPFFFAPFCAFVNQQREEPKKTKRERERSRVFIEARSFSFLRFPLFRSTSSEKGGGGTLFPSEMAAPAPKRRALGGGRGLAALVAGARAKRAEINLLEDENGDGVDAAAACLRGGGGGGRIGVVTAAEKPLQPAAPSNSQPSATPAAIRPALFYGGSLPRPPLHAVHQLSTPGSAPVLAISNAFRGSVGGGGVPSASAAFAAGMKTR